MPDYPTAPLTAVEITPEFWVTSQLFPAQIAELKELGFTRVLSARPDEEEDEDEQPPRYLLEQQILQAGMQFSHLPIESGASFPESAIRSAAHLFSDEPKKTLAFCLTGIRSLRLWGLGNALAGTISPKEIQLRAKAAGFDMSQFSHHLERLSRKEAPFYVADDYANLI
jgi:sulfide:quinone oxidoreductase